MSQRLEKLQAEKKAAIELQQRKHNDWNENYELYRNKVKVNRLTQRQAVNIPLMKESIKTLLAGIDDPPSVLWKNLAGDEQKELVYQEIWDQQYLDNNMELIDVLDKKNVLLYGLSTKMLNICEYGVDVTVPDVFDIKLDPLTPPWDIDKARFIIQDNIFKSVREILANKKYSKEGKDDLKVWVDSAPGITAGNKNREEWEKKMERLKAMGVSSADFAYYAGGDRIVNLTQHFSLEWDDKEKEFVRCVTVYADDKIELYHDTLMECIGIDDFWPCEIWSEDIETNDVYPDAVADLIRTPNKVLNVWFSQMIENRTLKNFQMHWFLPGQNYTPQTYTPGPGMMLPAPPGDDINKVIKPVEISGLDDTFEAINALTAIVERGTGATAIQKGQAEQGQQTLGEVKILVGKAAERATAMTKFYRTSWYNLAWKWDRMMQANAPKFIKLYKQARSGKIYPKTVFRDDWKGDYKPIVRSTSEQESEETKSIQKFLFVTQQFPTNQALKMIAQKRELEILDLSPEELKQVEDEEKRNHEMEQKAAAMAANPQAAPSPIVGPAPQQQQVQQAQVQPQPEMAGGDITSMLQELTSLAV